MSHADDTIVAISTAAGLAARAIVRLSGPDAIRIAAGVFSPDEGSLSEMGEFHRTDGLVRLEEIGIELPGRAYLFRSPCSYTRQDVVELHVPGTPIVATAITADLVDGGARMAEAGEFTARAFFSGRIDLSRAEAVADVIDAADAAGLRAAMGALGGSVFRLCGKITERIAHALATVEASIDLAEEDIQLAGPDELSVDLEGIARELRGAADRAADMPESADRPHVVLAGEPNAGKSSLLNALSGTDRAIVSALAGTTRDVLSATMTLDDGAAVILQDAAGLADGGGELTLAADNAALQALRRADVLLFVVDATKNPGEYPPAMLDRVLSANDRAVAIVLASKIDLLDAVTAESVVENLRLGTGLDVIATSAVRPDGLDKLRGVLKDRLDLSVQRSGSALGLHERQKRCLRAAAGAMDEAVETLKLAGEISDVAEIAAVELRGALAQLGAISGQVVTEDILGKIFSRFCVGK